MTVNLDALAAARREALQEKPEVVFKGEHFMLPLEPDGRILDVLAVVARASKKMSAKDPGAMEDAANAITQFCELLMGERWEDFKALNPSLMDLMALAEAFPDLYGLDELGESLASRNSLPGIGEPSRPTSSASIEST